MSGMLLVVHEDDLVNLIEDMPGWHTIQVRYLNTDKSGRHYNVHLTKKQVAELGAAKIKAVYSATEYKAFQDKDQGRNDT